MNPYLGADAKSVIHHQVDHSATILMLAMETLEESEFFGENVDGFSAAWVVGHAACFADLFSSIFDGERSLDAGFHAVFNETDAVEDGPVSKAESVNRDLYPKKLLLLRFRQAVIKAQRALAAFDSSQWNAPGSPELPLSLRTGGEAWEIFAAHIYWHCGGLAGSMPRFFGTYPLNILPHHFDFVSRKKS